MSKEQPSYDFAAYGEAYAGAVFDGSVDLNTFSSPGAQVAALDAIRYVTERQPDHAVAVTQRKAEEPAFTGREPTPFWKRRAFALGTAAALIYTSAVASLSLLASQDQESEPPDNDHKPYAVWCGGDSFLPTGDVEVTTTKQGTELTVRKSTDTIALRGNVHVTVPKNIGVSSISLCNAGPEKFSPSLTVKGYVQTLTISGDGASLEVKPGGAIGQAGVNGRNCRVTLPPDQQGGNNTVHIEGPGCTVRSS